MKTVVYIVTRTVAGNPNINADAGATDTEIKNQRGEGSKSRGSILTSKLTPRP